ncbi:MAG: acyl-CoA thioesterase [Rikenellaceae bacterium]|nr:acyl-CoA thioesterase [Rikenellaceae bacterium]
MEEIVTPVQVRFSDTDMYGHVNNINIQSYFDMGKCDYITEVFGIPMISSLKTGLIQKCNTNTFEAQIRFGENIAVYTGVDKIGNKSITFSQKIVNTDTGELKSLSTAVLIAYDFKLQQSIDVPEEWRKKME